MKKKWKKREGTSGDVYWLIPSVVGRVEPGTAHSSTRGKGVTAVTLVRVGFGFGRACFIVLPGSLYSGFRDEQKSKVFSNGSHRTFTWLFLAFIVGLPLLPYLSMGIYQIYKIYQIYQRKNTYLIYTRYSIPGPGYQGKGFVRVGVGVGLGLHKPYSGSSWWTKKNVFRVSKGPRSSEDVYMSTCLHGFSYLGLIVRLDLCVHVYHTWHLGWGFVWVCLSLASASMGYPPKVLLSYVYIYTYVAQRVGGLEGLLLILIVGLVIKEQKKKNGSRSKESTCTSENV